MTDPERLPQSATRIVRLRCGGAESERIDRAPALGTRVQPTRLAYCGAGTTSLSQPLTAASRGGLA